MSATPIETLANACVERIQLLDTVAQVSLWLALLFGAGAAAIAVRNALRAPRPAGTAGAEAIAVPGGVDALVNAMISAPAWVGLFAAGLALSVTASSFSERVCLTATAPQPSAPAVKSAEAAASGEIGARSIALVASRDGRAWQLRAM